MLSAFGIGFFYRVVLPGIVVAVLVAPVRPHIILSWLEVSGLADRTTIFVMAVFTCGLVLSSARHVIYYAVEGFYWTPLQRHLRWRLTRKVQRKQKELAVLSSKSGAAKSERDALRKLHLTEFLGDFLISTEGGRPKYVVDRPTRIGNVIASYELYSRDRYGIDGVAYWFHLRYAASAGVQTELERTEAIADGMVFCMAATGLISAAYCVVLAGRFAGTLLGAVGYNGWLPGAPVADGVLVLGAALSATASIGFNRLSIFALRTFGKQMRAVTDMCLPAVLKLAEPWLPNDEQRQALARRAQYLRHGASVTPSTASPGEAVAPREENRS